MPFVQYSQELMPVAIKPIGQALISIRIKKYVESNEKSEPNKSRLFKCVSLLKKYPAFYMKLNELGNTLQSGRYFCYSLMHVNWIPQFLIPNRDPFEQRRRLRRLEAYATRLRDRASALPQPHCH